MVIGFFSKSCLRRRRINASTGENSWLSWSAWGTSASTFTEGQSCWERTKWLLQSRILSQVARWIDRLQELGFEIEQVSWKRGYTIEETMPGRLCTLQPSRREGRHGKENHRCRWSLTDGRTSERPRERYLAEADRRMEDGSSSTNLAERFYCVICKEDVDDWCRIFSIYAPSNGPQNHPKAPMRYVGSPFEIIADDVAGFPPHRTNTSWWWRATSARVEA